MKNKGFTLIELLAVIVILAIIALIATPIILNIIDDSRTATKQRSVDMYRKAVENAVSNYLLENPTDNEVTFDEIYDYIAYDGEKVSCVVTINSKTGGVGVSGCIVGGERIDYTSGSFDNIISISVNNSSAPANEILPIDINGDELLKISNLGYTTTNFTKEETITYTFKVKNTSDTNITLSGLIMEDRASSCIIDGVSANAKKCNNNSLSVIINEVEYTDTSVMSISLAANETLEIVAKVEYYGDDTINNNLQIDYDDIQLLFRSPYTKVTNPKIGDVNADGYINDIDVYYVSSVIAGYTFNDLNINTLGDTDCNSKIDITDVALLDKYVEGWDLTDIYIGTDSCPIN